MKPPVLCDVVLASDASSPALVVPEDSRSVTVDELAGGIESVAGALTALGVERGNCVALSLPPGPELIVAMLAIVSLGAAAAPLNPAYTVAEFQFFLDDLAPRVVLLPTGELRAARDAASADLTIVDMAVGERAAPTLIRGGQPVSPVAARRDAQPDDVALLLHTSGTTSRPKQVPLLQRNLVSSVRAIGRHFELGPDDVAYCAMPLFHVHGLIGSVFSSLAAGGSVIVPRRFSTRAFWEHRGRFAPTWFSAVPTIYQAILERDPGVDVTDTKDHLRFMRSASSPLAPSLLERIEARFEVPMLEAYGMTEGSHQIAANPIAAGLRRPGSVGVATGSEIVVLDEHGRRLPDGERGEVAIRGPGVTPGYLNNPEANAAAFVDGWFRTGDRGVIDEGFVRLDGRLKELINRGGEKISPHEVENVLLNHPSVAEAACFAVSDAKYGEQVGAAVRIIDDTPMEALLEHCRERLAAFKIPRRIEAVEAIPRTATGKMQRNRMSERLGWE